jgi:ubiquinone/menaquinone biosynthesis C-methylase UbiE
LYFLVELYYDPKMITSVNDIFSYVNVLTERFSLPKDIRKRALMLLGDMSGKTVLEFGCGIGTITLPLLKAVGPYGLVYATHFSKNDLRIVKKRYELKDWMSEEKELARLRLVHDQEHFHRLNPEISYADAVVSVGMLSYLQKPKNILEQIYSIMPIGGRICLVEYSDYFHLIPNPEWLSKEAKIEKLFRDVGFSVRVIRKKGLLWNYLFIYGIKFGTDVPYI